MTQGGYLLGISLLSLSGCEALWGGFYKDPQLQDLSAAFDAGPTGCQANADCPSGACVDVQLGPYTPGSCIPTDALLYVDWDNCSTGTKSGQPGNPFCEVQDAIAKIQPLDPQLHIFQVKHSASHQYKGVTILYGNLALLGPWADPKLTGTQWDQSAAATLLGTAAAALTIQVQADKGPVVAIVDGFALQASGNGLGVDVSNFGPGSTLTLRRTTVSGSSGYGINVNNPGPATLTVDRCKVTGSHGVGLYLSSQISMFTITNSLFTLNGVQPGSGTTGVILNGVSVGIFDHNTVTYNGASGVAGGISCMQPSQSISNSIVLKNSHVNGSQFLGSNVSTTPNCLLRKTIVDDLDENIKDGLTCNLGLASGSLLTTGQGACAIDGAMDNPDRSLDYFGTRRPQGLHSDIGFHELVKP